MNDLVVVVMPSCSTARVPMLRRTIESLKNQKHPSVKPVIVADGNLATWNAAREMSVSCVINQTRRDWIYSMNRALRLFPADFYIYASDDLVFDPDCIRNAMLTMNRHFPDGDGVVSIKQILKREKGASTAFGMFGAAFANRFPDRQVFCPDYVHYYSDTELGRVATALKKLAHGSDAIVHHSRPRDETWDLAHLVLARDKAMRGERQRRGFEWGLDFELMSNSPKYNVNHENAGKQRRVPPPTART